MVPERFVRFCRATQPPPGWQRPKDEEAVQHADNEEVANGTDEEADNVARPQQWDQRNQDRHEPDRVPGAKSLIKCAYVPAESG